MNDIQQCELITLQAIFPETFQQLSDTQFTFIFPSQYYKCDFKFTITYSPGYPMQQLAQFDIEAPQLHDTLAQTVFNKLTSLQQQLMNPDEAYIFQLIQSIDDDQFRVEIIFQDQKIEQIEDDEDAVLVKINHGELPGKPVTDENYHKWFADFTKKKGIKLLEEEDWSKIDYNTEMGATFTGYEYFKRKNDEK
ncbi:RWD_domain-containing protein [Hexamita inflata]|uniref:RWD domain-containing protein n=1 Tax=Hexamita inflata TaxID=28002 RepID=A0AA86P9F1_9EUKA|nr:RWD domain-containing protein [Hexamita inflata]CAI9933366.1 RWD domain-containing protein [Hexamita inflata]